MLLGLVLGERWEPAGGELGPPERGRLAVARAAEAELDDGVVRAARSSGALSSAWSE
jgi:hypothetical protein